MGWTSLHVESCKPMWNHAIIDPYSTVLHRFATFHVKRGPPHTTRESVWNETYYCIYSTCLQLDRYIYVKVKEIEMFFNTFVTSRPEEGWAEGRTWHLYLENRCLKGRCLGSSEPAGGSKIYQRLEGSILLYSRSVIPARRSLFGKGT